MLCVHCLPARGSATPMKMGGGGTGTRRQRIQDFRQRQLIPKTENSADLAHYFPENGGGLFPALKNGGGRVPPSPLWRSPCFQHSTSVIQCDWCPTHKTRDAEPCKFRTAPAPAPKNYPGSEPHAPAPGKMYRLRLRGCEVVQIWDDSGSISKKTIPAPAPAQEKMSGYGSASLPKP